MKIFKSTAIGFIASLFLLLAGTADTLAACQVSANVCTCIEIGPGDSRPGKTCDAGKECYVKSTRPDGSQLMDCRPVSTGSKTETNAADLPKIANPGDMVKIKIPFMKFDAPTCTGSMETKDQECKIPWIANYIDGIYKYLVGIVGIIATVSLMIGGIRWLSSAGNQQAIGEAKAYIASALIGMVLLLSSYIILDTINPDIVNMQPIKVKTIPEAEEEIDSEGSYSDTEVIADTAGLVSVPGGVCLKGNTVCKLQNSTATRLQNAINIASQQGVRLSVTSAFRNRQTQVKLWNDEMAKQKAKGLNDAAATAAARKVVAPPGRSSHESGYAIDICIANTKSCHKINRYNTRYSDADVVKLQAIMRQAGFKRYCGEWWHFQPQEKPPKVSCS